MQDHNANTVPNLTAARLIRSIRHELWQPVSTIIGYAELLATRRLDDQERAWMLENIRRAAGQLAVYLDRLERGEGLEPPAPKRSGD
jgi:signal transduction histidine kinase